MCDKLVGLGVVLDVFVDAEMSSRLLPIHAPVVPDVCVNVKMFVSM